MRDGDASSAAREKRTIRLINTYEPVSPIYRDVIPSLLSEDLSIEVIISTAEYRARAIPFEKVSVSPGMVVTRIYSPVSKAKSRFAKIVIMAFYATLTSIYTLISPRSVINVFFTQPPMFYTWGMVLKVIRKQPYICFIMDLYPDVLIADGLLEKRGVIARVAKRLSLIALKRAETVVVLGRCVADKLEQEGIHSDRLVIINNWINAGSIAYLDHQSNMLRKKWGLNKKFVILYSGNQGLVHTFDEILGVALKLKEIQEIVFVFVGEGPRHKEIINWKELHNLENMLIAPMQPSSLLKESLGVADVHYVSLRSGFEGVVVPSKIYGALATGRPIIYMGEPGGEIARALTEDGSGIVVNLKDECSLELAIMTYYSDRERLRRDGYAAEKSSLRQYSMNTQIAKFSQLMANKSAC